MIGNNNNNTINGNNNAISAGNTTTANNGTATTATAAGNSTQSAQSAALSNPGSSQRADTIARRELTAAGISNPTQVQLQTALNGGTVTNAQGQSTTMDGVLRQREQGMGWGNIAKANGVSPSQSEQGAANAQRGRDIAGADDRRERFSQALSSHDGRNQIGGGQESRTLAMNSPSSGNTLDRDNARKQSAQDNRSGTEGGLKGPGNGGGKGRSEHANGHSDRGAVALSANAGSNVRAGAGAGGGGGVRVGAGGDTNASVGVVGGGNGHGGGKGNGNGNGNKGAK